VTRLALNCLKAAICAVFYFLVAPLLAVLVR
jgi:hypothetical protein